MKGLGTEGWQELETAEDSLNVDELSDLFSHVQQDETSGVDFSVFMEEQDALDVDEINELFSEADDGTSSESASSHTTVSSPPASVVSKEDEAALAEETAVLDVTETDVLDAQNVDVLSELFTACEDSAAVLDAENDMQEEANATDVADAANVELLSELFSAGLEDKEASMVVDTTAPTTSTDLPIDSQDARNVDVMAELFTSLEAQIEAEQSVSSPVLPTEATPHDWIDALEVDNVASLFAELEEKPMTSRASQEPVVAKVDSRIFVPQFAVRMEGQHRPVRAPVCSATPSLLASPPGAFLAGPPLPAAQGARREDRVDRWKTKRKSRSTAKASDASISDTRRACAAKRQRVKGRFVRDSQGFVSITALQQ